MPSRQWNLFNRTADFADAVCDFSRRLPSTPEAQEVASQLRRASTSVAANYRAARRGRSHAEFTAKIGVVLEEADEALYWLDHCARTPLARRFKEVESLRSEANELVALFTTAQQTAQRNRDGRRRRQNPIRSRK